MAIPTVHRKLREDGSFVLHHYPNSASITSTPFDTRALQLHSQVTDAIRSLNLGQGKLG